jgi:hypothetical protein
MVCGLPISRKLTDTTVFDRSSTTRGGARRHDVFPGAERAAYLTHAR